MFLGKSLKRLRYPIEDGRAIIEIKIKTIHQLFDERDPAPFRERDLDDDAVEYIMTSALEITEKRLGKLRIYVNEPLPSAQVDMVRLAVHTFFHYEYDLMSKKIRSVFGIGIKSLAIGVMFLTGSIWISATYSPYFDEFWSLFFKEMMIVIGWVSMWKPFNIFLYEWWPLIDIRQIYKRLSDLEIEVTQSQNGDLIFGAKQSASL